MTTQPHFSRQLVASRHGVDSEGRVIPVGSWPLNRQAPGSLESVRRFLNTTSRESGAELLHGIAGVRSFARREGFPLGTSIRSADVDRLLELRGLLHLAVVRRHIPRELNDIARRSIVSMTLSPTVSFVVQGSGVEPFVSTIIVRVHQSMTDGTWNRLHACSNKQCQWVVFDHSKNRSLRWCAEEACGFRDRARRRQATLKT